MTKLDRQLQALLRKFEPRMAAAFIAAVRDITSQAVFADLIDAIERRDVEAALRAVDFDRAAFSGQVAVMTEAFSAGGAVVSANTAWRGVGGQRVVIRWDLHNPRAQSIIQESSSRFITQISNETRKTVRTVMGEGYSAGRGPRDIALDLVGRVSGSGRVGGVIGLSDPQTQYVKNLREVLETNPRGYFNVNRETGVWEMRFTKADKRYNTMIRKAIDSGEPLSQKSIDKIVERYSDRLLKVRADTIARTETAQSVEASRQEAFAQWQEKTGAPNEAIVRRWDHPGGKNSRDWHSAMNGWEIRGMEQPWVTPRGGRLMYPCDSSLDAGAGEIVNCRCMQTIYIDYTMLR